MFSKSGFVKLLGVVNGTFYLSSMVGAQISSAVRVKNNVNDVVVNYLQKAIKSFSGLAKNAKTFEKSAKKKKVDFLKRKMFGQSLLYAAQNAETLDELFTVLYFSKHLFGFKEQESNANNQNSWVSSFLRNPFYLRSFSNYFWAKMFDFASEDGISLKDYNSAVLDFFKKLKEEHKEDFERDRVEDASELFIVCMSRVMDYAKLSSEKLEDLFVGSCSSAKVVKSVLRNVLNDLAKKSKLVYESTIFNEERSWSEEKKEYFFKVSKLSNVLDECANVFKLDYERKDQSGYVNVGGLLEYLLKKNIPLKELFVLMEELVEEQEKQREGMFGNGAKFGIFLEEQQDENEINNMNLINNRIEIEEKLDKNKFDKKEYDDEKMCPTFRGVNIINNNQENEEDEKDEESEKDERNENEKDENGTMYGVAVGF